MQSEILFSLFRAQKCKISNYRATKNCLTCEISQICSKEVQPRIVYSAL